MARSAQSARQCRYDLMQRILVEPDERALQNERNGVACGHAPLVEHQGLTARVQKKNGLRRASQLHDHGTNAKKIRHS